MQQPPTGDYVNWLRVQDGQLRMEEAQLAAEEQWLRQKHEYPRPFLQMQLYRKILPPKILLLVKNS